MIEQFLGIQQVRMVGRVCMGLTALAVAYILYFFITAYNSPLLTGQDRLAEHRPVLITAPALDQGSYSALAGALHSRQLFSSMGQAPTLEPAADQLPDNFKIVGVVLAQPAEVVIEDAAAKQTYFITPQTPQGGISISKVAKGQVLLNYQGHTIVVPVQRPKVNLPTTNGSTTNAQIP